MNEKEIIELYNKVIRLYGIYTQCDQVIEEIAELIQAINKFKRGKAHNVEEEIADCEIMLEQMRIMFDSNKINKIKRKKILRLQRKVDKRLNVGL